LLFAATAYLAVTSMRSIYWWTTIALVVLCPLVLQDQTSDPSLETPLEQTTNMQGIAHTLFLAALVTMAVFMQPGTKLQAHLLAEIDADARHHGEGAYVLNHQHPFELIRALATLGYPGRLFHHQCIGGLLEFELTDGKNPRPVAFVDQRMEFIPPHVWEDYFIIENAQADTWQQLIDTYEIGAFLLFGEEQQALIARLESDPRWIPVANDPFFILFLDGEDEETLLRWREAF
jgi:hypothetical protein